MKIHIPNADPSPETLWRAIEITMKIHITNADPGPENLWRTIEITMKFMAYN